MTKEKIVDLKQDLKEIWEDLVDVTASIESLATLMSGSEDIPSSARSGLSHLLMNLSEEVQELTSRLEDQVSCIPAGDA